uniref:Integrase, catalytic region, zinc finger, CCHC-type, peptidase aspartic, catalytic n=1 Tax=Tanacetum cinerariifolium TaxID=118510 RepID=A0A699HKK3_TANCI|nr:hypothetical protein [Tanacetum cinerariifolium]
MLLVQAQESGQALDEEQLAFLADLRILDGQAIQTTIPQNAAFQTDDLDAYDSDCNDISLEKAVLMANLSSYDSDVLLEKHDVISMDDEEETLILEKENRSKMLEKQNYPISKEKKINISPISYNELNKLAEDFGKCFVPQMQMSAEQAFRLPLSNPKSEQLDIIQTPVEIEVPKELLEKELSLDNDRLLDHVICQDVMNIAIHVDSVLANVLPADNKCFIDEYNENVMLKAELAKKGQMVEKAIFDEAVLRCSRLENRNVNLELKLQHQKESFLINRPLNNQNASEILEFFKINEWQARLDAKDVLITNLRNHIESLKGKNVVEKMAD